VNVKLTVANFYRWTRSVRFVESRAKLGFIDGKCAQHAVNSTTYNQWIRCDSMVAGWLLDFVVPFEALLYVYSATELWDEL